MSEKTQIQQLQEWRELVDYVLAESGRSSIPCLQCVPDNSLGIRFSSETDILTSRVLLRFEYRVNGREGFVSRDIDESSLSRLNQQDPLRTDALELIRSAIDEIIARIAGELCGEVVNQILRSEGRNSAFGQALQKSLLNKNA